jgi:hypothetical protein
VRFDPRIFALLLVLAVPAAQAQLWSGPAAVEIRVEDQKGLPLAGAQLQLQYKALEPRDGPPPVLTDSRGKAVIGGLAEGSWHLEVSHEGFMTYLAEITVREKGRLVLEEAAQFNVVGATRTMQVQISRAKSAPAPRPSVIAEKPVPPPPVSTPPDPPMPAPQPEIPPVASAPPREEPAAAPAPVPSPPGPAEPSTPKPTPEPQAAPPAPEPPVARPTTPPIPPSAAPQPEAPPAVEPPQAKPTTPPPPTIPAPEPTLRPTPALPAAPPADPVRLRTAKDRTCFECPPGESSLSTERVVAPGGGSGCGAGIASQLQDGEVPAGLPAGCHVLRIALPAGARYTGYRFEVQAGGDPLDCLAGQSCPQGAGRWPINPVLVRQPTGTIILAPFEAGPAERERRAVLTVYFSTEMTRRPR